MTGLRSTGTTILIVGLLGAGLAACGPDRSAPGSSFTTPGAVYNSDRAAPTQATYPAGSDVSPGADDALRELALLGGGRAVVWVDPANKRRVLFQHSDPADPDGWTKPVTVFTAGDGCLQVEATAKNGVLAIGLGCYQYDTFAQQAPDQGAVAISTDLATFQLDDDIRGEFAPGKPQIARGEVSFPNTVGDASVSWSSSNGFRAEQT